jgi:hypothetical protein
MAMSATTEMAKYTVAGLHKWRKSFKTRPISAMDWIIGIGIDIMYANI